MDEHKHIFLDETDTRLERCCSLLCSRFLCLALYLSFLTFLVVLGLSGGWLSNLEQRLPFGFLQFVADHRLLILVVPALCLALCYAALRRLTGEIMAVPERYLDERQKMVRDQAHRSAFTIVKVACLLLPALFCLGVLPWFNQSGPVAWEATRYIQTLHSTTYALVTSSAHPTTLKSLTILYGHPGNVTWNEISFSGSIMGMQSPAQLDANEIMLAVALLLLCLFLIISALPMSVIAWKGRT